MFIILIYKGDDIMAITLGGAALMSAPIVLQLASMLAGKWRGNKDETQPLDVFRQLKITPEQQALMEKNLAGGRDILSQPQTIYTPGQVGVQQQPDITQFLPQQVGQYQGYSPVPGSLAAILGQMQQLARAGYEQDLANIAGRQRSSRSIMPRTSGSLALRNEALKNRAAQLAQTQFNTVANFANRNALAGIQGQNLETRRGAATNQLQDLLSKIRQQQAQNLYTGAFNQQRQNMGEAQLRNIQEQERYGQGLRRYNIGMSNPYNVSQLPQGGQ